MSAKAREKNWNTRHKNISASGKMSTIHNMKRHEIKRAIGRDRKAMDKMLTLYEISNEYKDIADDQCLTFWKAYLGRD